MNVERRGRGTHLDSSEGKNKTNSDLNQSQKAGAWTLLQQGPSADLSTLLQAPSYGVFFIADLNRQVNSTSGASSTDGGTSFLTLPTISPVIIEMMLNISTLPLSTALDNNDSLRSSRVSYS